MKITYPNMGSLGIAVRSLLEGLGFKVVVPPLITKKSATLGTQNAPEGACYPFKLVLGNVMEALEQGADTIIMLGGAGPCRFGYFGHLMGEILRDSAYGCDTIILEGEGVVGQINALRTAAKAAWIDVAKALRLAWKKIELADKLEAKVNRYRAIETKNGAMSNIHAHGLQLIEKAASEKELRDIDDFLLEKIKQFCDQRKKPVLNIGIVGDIYMLIEPYANQNIEKVLGNMGVETHRSIYVSSWVKEHMGLWLSRIHKKGLLADAKPYLRDFVGGHGLDTIANTVRYHRKGFDGILHILPMTCMPEIVAQSITPSLNRDLGIPVMTLVLDEHSGTAGLESRLEAYVEILKRKKCATG